jgi:hypothetical protein
MTTDIGGIDNCYQIFSFRKYRFVPDIRQTAHVRLRR